MSYEAYALYEECGYEESHTSWELWELEATTLEEAREEAREEAKEQWAQEAAGWDCNVEQVLVLPTGYVPLNYGDIRDRVIAVAARRAQSTEERDAAEYKRLKAKYDPPDLSTLPPGMHATNDFGDDE